MKYKAQIMKGWVPGSNLSSGEILNQRSSTPVTLDLAPCAVQNDPKTLNNTESSWSA